MNLNDITTKPYILALFKRDDGTRFLLGSGAYEFKDDQQHFVANTMANDVVEVQGSDGALLAGQVRRSATQNFDGFIADASSTKGSVENYRKAFIAFFQKNHYYTVVYIFADGTAIQRRRGFIVDAPEVKELWQMTPEYHVALNFEDVNYYKYAENASGDEIYSNLANLTSKITASGGLIWDSLGSATTTAEGTNFTIFGTTAEDNLESVQLKGQTEQASYTGKNLYQLRTTQTQNGITFTNNGDGTFNISGTATAQAEFTLHTTTAQSRIIAGQTYTLSSSAPVTNQGIQYYIHNTNSSGIWQNTIMAFNTDGTRTAGTTGDYVDFRVVIFSGKTVNYTNVKTQLELGSTATSFEPYVGGTASPNPDYPQTVQTVTGTQTITISDGASQSQTLSVRLGSVELCKLGTYQDYIFKSNGNWYIHKEIKKLDVSSLTGWYLNNNTNFRTLTGVSDIVFPSSNDTVGIILSPSYTAQTANSLGNASYDYGIALGAASYISVRNKDITTLQAFETYLANNQIYAYVALTTPTDTQITDADLISDLNDLLGADTYEGSTSFESSATGNLPAWLVVEAKTGSGGVIWDNIGATWEEGGEAGDTFITVDSITEVFPTITITGPASNPQISNITTGQILKYTGNVTSSQKLVIDIQQKTAKLNGTSVISNVSGDWLYLMPGNNRMVYTIDNAEPNTAIIEWQEITG